MNLLEKIRQLLWPRDSSAEVDPHPGRGVAGGVKEDDKPPVQPANLRPLDASQEALEKDLEYALGLSRTYLGILAREFLQGKTVLEIGPGHNLGFPLILGCQGARVMVADRFLTPWDPNYHPLFYSRLREALPKYWALNDTTPLDRILAAGDYVPESITLHRCSLEELDYVPGESVDVVISNAVLEHLYDLPLAFAQLARLTRPGGLGIHQVDFRDHRDFSRPLEFLLLGEEDFREEFIYRQGECGNRCRPREMWRLFEEAGFRVNLFQPNMFAEEDYFTEFLERLREATDSVYCQYPAEDLRTISGLFLVTKEQP